MPVSEQRAAELFRLLADDPAQPFKTDYWCGPRNSLMIGRLLQNGISPHDIGQAMLWAPPTFLYTNGVLRPEMSCAPRLKPNLAAGQEVVVGPYLFREHQLNDHSRVTILNVDGSPIKEPTSSNPRQLRYAQGNDDRPSRWDNHIAPTLKVETATGSKIVVIDPRMADHPLTPQGWKDKQNCTQAVLMHAEQDGVLKLLPADAGAAKTIAEVARVKGIADPYERGQTDIVVAISGFHGRNAGRLVSYYDPPMMRDAKGQPSIEATVHYFEAWLHPLRILQDWVDGPRPQRDPRSSTLQTQIANSLQKNIS